MQRRPACIAFLAAIMVLACALPLYSAEPEESVDVESGLYYTIQKGDTLWDLSRKFMDTPWQWPEMWKENDQIPNPHWIYPGERIRLYRQHDLTLPDMGEEPMPEVKAPVRPAPYYIFSRIDMVGFIRKEPVTPVGEVFKTMEGRTIVSVGDEIYVRPAEAGARMPHGRFYVYKTFDPIRTSTWSEPIGTQHMLTGIVEVIENQPEYARCRIIRSFRAIETGQKLMPYERRSAKIPLQPGPTGLSAAILSAEEGSSVFGDNTIAFMNKGEKDGVSPGQVFEVLFKQSEKIRKKDKEATTLSPLPVGKVLVLLTQPGFATVLVTGAENELLPGATVRAPLH